MTTGADGSGADGPGAGGKDAGGKPGDVAAPRRMGWAAPALLRRGALARRTAGPRAEPKPTGIVRPDPALAEIAQAETLSAEALAGPAAPRLQGGGRRAPPALVSYILLALLPALCVAAYYLFIAADQYAAAARFTVREVAGEGLFAMTAGEAAEDADAVAPPAVDMVSHLSHVAASYLRSRALVEALVEKAALRARYDRPEADFWARLPPDAPIEEVMDYWEARTDVALDGPSRIVTFRVRAFRPEDAHALADAALAETEALVNQLSLRRKRDALARARAGAGAAEAQLRGAVAAMSALRDDEGLVDPEREAGETLALMGDLMRERIAAAGELAALEGLLAEDAPRRVQLGGRIARLDADLARLRGALAGAVSGDATMAAALARFEEAEVRLRFAAKLYEIAQAALIGAEIEFARQSVYVEVFDPPAVPEESRHPRREAFSILALVGFSAIWAIGALVVASVRDHRIAP